jgi:hypothetical protein
MAVVLTAPFMDHSFNFKYFESSDQREKPRCSESQP